MPSWTLGEESAALGYTYLKVPLALGKTYFPGSDCMRGSHKITDYLAAVKELPLSYNNEETLPCTKYVCMIAF